MRKTKTLLIILSIALFLFFNGCGASVNNGKEDGENSFSQLILDIERIMEDSRFENAHWGVYIKSLETGKVWYEQNAVKMYMPASNEKIITGAAFLETLGPDFRIETTLSYTGDKKEDTITGDLIVKGYGDPTLYSRFYDSPTTVFEQWADSLLSLGITFIDGNLIGDDNAFDDNSIGYGWPLDGLDVWYSAEISPLSLNENYVDLKIVPPASVSGTVEIIPNLPSSYYSVLNNVSVTKEGYNSVSVSRLFGTNTILVNGTVAAGSNAFERSPSITNPTKFYVTVLKEVFESKGITIRGEALDGDEIADFESTLTGKKVLIRHHSHPLKELLGMMMKRSQNLYAELFPRILALQNGKEGTFREGKKVVEAYLKNLGIEPDSYRYMDGSGLSRYNYVSPYQLTIILEAMVKSPNWKYWYDALPIAGVDGTLRNRMKETAAMRNVRAKTGTISNVRGLSGYVTTADGEQLVFSFLVNGHLRSSKETEEITDPILVLLANYSEREN